MRRHSTHRRWLLLAGIVLAATAAGGAFAAFPDTNVDTYTGCLNVGGSSGGAINGVTNGLSPLKPCGPNQQLIHLSGGDITKVTAGSGLTGGGDNGAVTLGIDGSHSLPQGCASGQVPKSNGSTWFCGADNTASDVWVTHLDSFDLEEAHNLTVTELSLPAGAYLFHATAAALDNIGSGNGEVSVDCDLRQTDPGNAFIGESLADDGDPALLAGETIAISGVMSSNTGFTVTLECEGQGDDHLELVNLTALKVGTVHDQSS